MRRAIFAIFAGLALVGALGASSISPPYVHPTSPMLSSIRTTNGETAATFTANGSTAIYRDNAPALEPTATGWVSIYGSATAATPPTSYVGDAVYEWRDSDGSDAIAQLGFTPSFGSTLRLVNRVHGGSVAITAEDTSGTVNELWSGDGDEGPWQGSYAATTIGCGTEINLTVHYQKTGDMVDMEVVADTADTCTSDDDIFGWTGTNSPTFIRPSANTVAIGPNGVFTNNGALSAGPFSAIVQSNGGVNVQLGAFSSLTASGWTASGSKGFVGPAGSADGRAFIRYRLN